MSLLPMLFAWTLALQSSMSGGGEAQAPATQDTSPIVAATRHFEFHSDPRITLHHFLIAWASADAGEWPPYARPLVAERDTWRLLLDEDERRAWSAALEAYKGEVTRLVLEEHGQPRYKHYGEFGLYQRGERWSVELPALEGHWQPYLQSASQDPAARRAALEAFAGQLLTHGVGAR